LAPSESSLCSPSQPTNSITAHFFKRVMEVLFLHVYSGKMEIGQVFCLSFSLVPCC
jgi:hypothetical protein